MIVNKSHFDEAFVRVKPSVQAKVKINYLLVTMKIDFLVAVKLSKNMTLGFLSYRKEKNMPKWRKR